MKFAIEICMDNTEGILERVLGRLRQRGFSICAIFCNRSKDTTLLNARITVEGSRQSELAEKQLGKLHDVQYVLVEQLEETNDYGFEYNQTTDRVEFDLPLRYYA